MGLVPDTIVPTPTDFQAANVDTVRKLWSDTIIQSARMEDTLYDRQMGTTVAGKPTAGGRIVEIARDTAAQKGQEVTFTIQREVYRKGVQSGANFTSSGQYNTRTTGFDKIKVDLKSDSFSTDLYTSQLMGYQMDLLGSEPELLGRLTGRYRQWDLMLTTLHRSGNENRLFAGGRNSLAELTGADTLKGSDLTVAQSIMTGTLGSTPAYVRMDENGNNVQGFHVITTAEGYGMLKLDPEIQRALEKAAPRSTDNPLFSGGLTHWDGHTVQWLAGVLHSDAGEVGSPFAPIALLGYAIGNPDLTVGTTTSEQITGGRNNTWADDTEVQYMKAFPWAYKFLNGDVLSTAVQTLNPYYTNRDFWGFRGSDTTNDADGTTWDANPYFYVCVCNPLNAAVQPGRWAIFKILVASNNGNRFTAIAERLGPTTSGIQHQKVGDVSFDPTVHGTYFGLEARVLLCNPSGVPIMASPMHGAAALRRAFGAWMNRLAEEEYQGKNRLVYMHNICGHGLRRDANGRAVGVMNIVHATRYHDIKHG